MKERDDLLWFYERMEKEDASVSLRQLLLLLITKIEELHQRLNVLEGDEER